MKFLKRLLLALLGIVLLLVVWFFCLPVPLACAVNFGARRALGDGDMAVHVDSAVFRWRLGSETARFDVGGVKTTVQGRPLSTVQSIAIDIDKSAVWHRHYAPRRVVVTSPEVLMDLTPKGAVAAMSSAPKPTSPQPPSAPLEFAALLPALPPVGGECLVQLHGAAVDFVASDAQRWSPPTAEIEIRVQRDERHARVTGFADFGVEGHPLRIDFSGNAETATGRLQFGVTLPPVKTSDLPKLPGREFPLQGSLAFDATGEYDWSAHTLTVARGGALVTDATMTLPGLSGPPLAIERAELRVKANLVPEAGRGVLTEVEKGVFVVDGNRLEIKSLAVELGAITRAKWAAEVSGVEGRRAAARLPAALTKSLPWLADYLGEFGIPRLRSEGEAVLKHDTPSTWALQSVQVAQDLDVKIGDARVPVRASARSSEGGPMTVQAKVGPFEPRWFARGPFASLPVAAAAFPATLDVNADFSPKGDLLSAHTYVHGGAGSWLARPPLRGAVAVNRMDIEIAVGDGGKIVHVPKLQLETSAGAVQGETIELQQGANGAWNARGTLAVREVRGTVLAEVAPAAWFAPLAPFGADPHRMGLRRATTSFSAEIDPSKTVSPLTAAEMKSEIVAVIDDQPLAIAVTGTLPRGQRDATANVAIDSFRPSQFRSLGFGDFKARDFDFPVQVRADAVVSTQDWTPRRANAHVTLGRGAARVASLGATFPFENVDATVEYDFAGQVLRVPSATVRIAEGFQVRAEKVTVPLKGVTAVSGHVAIDPLSLPRTLAWWPEGFMPDVRKDARASLAAGELTHAAFDFAIELGPKGVVPKQVTGGLTLEKLRATRPELPTPATIDRVAVTADYPAAKVEIVNLREAGATLTDFAASTANVLQPTVEFTGRFSADVATALREAKTAGVLAGSTGKVSGEFSGRVPATPANLSGAQVKVALNGETLAVPGVLRGDVRFTTEAGVADRDTWTLRTSLDATKATVLALNRTVTTQPLEISASVKGWLTRDAPTAEVSVQGADLLGLPLAVRAEAAFADKGARVASAQLSEFRFGTTQLRGEWRGAAHRNDIAVDARRIDLPELVRTALACLPPTDNSTAVKSPAKTAQAQASNGPTFPGVLAVKFTADEIGFGHQHGVHRVEARAEMENGWPRSAAFRAIEGTANAIALELKEGKEAQPFQVGVSDLSAWLQAVVEPLRNAKLPAGPLGESIRSAAHIPELIAGGRVEIVGDVAQSDDGVSAHGRFVLANATMVRAPRILQLLAFKSGKTLQSSPLIREFTIGEWAYEDDTVSIKRLNLVGSGLIDRVKLNSAHYTLTNEKLGIDGEYFGIGFEVIGTRSDPQVFLKENAVIRAVGHKNEFDFFNDEEDEPAKDKPKPKKK